MANPNGDPSEPAATGTELGVATPWHIPDAGIIGHSPNLPPTARIPAVLNSTYDERVKDEEQPTTPHENSLGWGLCFEVGLGVIALLCGQFTYVWPAEKLGWPTLPVLAIGVVSTIPALLFALGIQRLPVPFFQDLTRLVEERVLPLFQHLTVFELALLSLAAGWGEELLFRGLIQAELTHGTNATMGILVASVAFGMAHFLSLAYFVLAVAMSLYLGWLFWQTESLWVPMLAHACYDFVMLLILRRSRSPDVE